MNNKLQKLKKLQEIIKHYKQQNKRVVWTNGCFDILHVGHVTYLEGARGLGEVLVVGLNSDVSVRGIKGEERPVFDQQVRARVLGALTCVDHIVIFDQPSPVDLLNILRPDIYVKGGDYAIETINQEERRTVEAYGGKVEIMPLMQGMSTTEIINKIVRLG